MNDSSSSFPSRRCVESHFLDVTKFGFAARFINAKHHVRRPTAATNQNWFAVNFEQSVALRSEFGICLDKADEFFLDIRNGGIGFDKFKPEMMKIRLAHLVGPQVLFGQIENFGGLP